MSPDQTDGTKLSSLASLSTFLTLIVTNSVKLAGAYLIYLEQQGQGRTPVLLVSLALALGGQVVENALLRAIDKFFGRE